MEWFTLLLYVLGAFMFYGMMDVPPVIRMNPILKFVLVVIWPVIASVAFIVFLLVMMGLVDEKRVK